MFKRYLDKVDNFSQRKRFFSRRSYNMGLRKFLFVSLLFLLFTIVAVYLVGRGANLKLLYLVVISSFFALSMFVIFRIRYANEVMMDIEMQNLIFATAARMSSDFCIILNNKGSTFYCDSFFHDIFMNSTTNARASEMDYLIHNTMFSNEQKEMIISLIAKKDKIDTTIDGVHPELGEIEVRFEPLVVSFNGHEEVFLIIRGIKKKKLMN